MTRARCGLYRSKPNSRPAPAGSEPELAGAAPSLDGGVLWITGCA
jgi:hypothetical protein